jgi:hypothetical protein
MVYFSTIINNTPHLDYLKKMINGLKQDASNFTIMNAFDPTVAKEKKFRTWFTNNLILYLMRFKVVYGSSISLHIQTYQSF